MEKEGKIPAVKIGCGKNNRVINHVTYDQEQIEKIQTISGRRWKPKGGIYGLFAYTSELSAYPNDMDINELSEIC